MRWTQGRGKINLNIHFIKMIYVMVKVVTKNKISFPRTKIKNSYAKKNEFIYSYFEGVLNNNGSLPI